MVTLAAVSLFTVTILLLNYHRKLTTKYPCFSASPMVHHSLVLQKWIDDLSQNKSVNVKESVTLTVTTQKAAVMNRVL